MLRLWVHLDLKDHEWIRATDEVVLEHLKEQMRVVQEAATPMEALGCNDAADLRACFLRASKLYHPSRFARRPKTIRDLSNEVFLLLKKAYDKARKGFTSDALDGTRKKIASAREERGGRQRGGKRASTNPADRIELQERRRNQIRNQLGNAGKNSTAQVRSVTDRSFSESQSDLKEEANFASALERMEEGDFEGAAKGFKAAAVSRPSEKRYRLHMHYAQGRVLQADGKMDESRAEYKRCLGLDASFVAAHEAMLSLPKHGKKKKSLMSKLFGK